ncbi:hypothetical protein J539_3337 [Acinetobacter baumannii 342950]|nr:hypothetical protein J539_3337 [Acinetobacter baumannii 342950]
MFEIVILFFLIGTNLYVQIRTWDKVLILIYLNEYLLTH